MQGNAELCPDGNDLGLAQTRVLTVATAAISNITLPAILHGQFADLLHNLSRGSITPYDWIDL